MGSYMTVPSSPLLCSSLLFYKVSSLFSGGIETGLVTKGSRANVSASDAGDAGGAGSGAGGALWF